jgi:hypothetical protein
MQWFKERWETVYESLTLRRVVALPIFIAVVNGVASLVEFLARREGHTLLGVPPLAWAVIAGLLLLLCWVIESGTKQRQSLLPKISVSFNPAAEGMVQTRTEVYDGPKKVRDDRAVYIRITINALSRTTVKGCVAFLTKVEKRAKPASLFADVPISGALALTQTPFDVYPRVPATVDFLKCGQFDNRLGFSVPTPFRLENILDNHATYRFTIEVNGEGVSETRCVEVDWTGTWDGIVAR